MTSFLNTRFVYLVPPRTPDSYHPPLDSVSMEAGGTLGELTDRLVWYLLEAVMSP